MRIAILGSRNALKDPLSLIHNASDLRSWFFTKYLGERGYEVDFYLWDWNVPTLRREVDHFICTINNGGIHRLIEKLGDDAVIPTLRPMVRRHIIDMSDSPRYPLKTDRFFSMIPSKTHTSCDYIGWAADQYILNPKKTNKIRILVDHSLYVDGFDASETVMQGLKAFADDSNVEIYQIRNNGFCKIDLKVPYTKEIYDRKMQIPYPDICEEYNKADIFIVTHAESLGLSVIESAMAGAHIVAYKGAIKPPLIDPLSHSFYDTNDPSSVTNVVREYIKKKEDPRRVRKFAMPWTWNACIDKIQTILNY